MLIFLNSKSILNYSHTRLLFAVLGLAWLGGCAFAPGLSIGKGIKAAESTANPYSITTKRTSASAAAPGLGDPTAAVEAPPPGALMAITPELIRQQRALRKAELGADVKDLFADAKPYAIGPGDVINIVVWNHPELVLAPAGATLTTDASGLASVGNGYNVSPDGLIQFPLLGTFKIAGLTENMARQEMIRRLSKFLKDPQITLRVQAYRAGRVYVDAKCAPPACRPSTTFP
jgi:polysaccharide export outer membrane protein